MKRIISAEEAARIIGCSSQMVRERLKRGIWQFGRAIPPETKNGYWTYEVYVDKLNKYLGE